MFVASDRHFAEQASWKALTVLSHVAPVPLPVILYMRDFVLKCIKIPISQEATVLSLNANMQQFEEGSRPTTPAVRLGSQLGIRQQTISQQTLACKWVFYAAGGSSIATQKV